MMSLIQWHARFNFHNNILLLLALRLCSRRQSPIHFRSIEILFAIFTWTKYCIKLQCKYSTTVQSRYNDARSHQYSCAF